MTISIGLTVEDLAIVAIEGVQCSVDRDGVWLPVEDEPQYITPWESGSIATNCSELIDQYLMEKILDKNLTYNQIIELVRGGVLKKDYLKHEGNVVLVTGPLHWNNGAQITSISGNGLSIERLHGSEEFVIFGKDGVLVPKEDLSDLNKKIKTPGSFKTNRQLIEYYMDLFKKAFVKSGLNYNNDDQCVDFYFTSSRLEYKTTIFVKHLMKKSMVA